MSRKHQFEKKIFKEFNYKYQHSENSSVSLQLFILENVYSFDGSENQLTIARTYNIQFLCSYNLKWYPFDTQARYLDGDS